jgi:DNA-binding response OmpR family regulator
MRILLVEDEVMIAIYMEDLLADIGHDIAGHATRLTEAVELAERCECDFAILDVNLAGSMSFPVADILKRRGIPFAFATGYGSAAVLPPYDAHKIMHKPVREAELTRTLNDAAA